MSAGGAHRSVRAVVTDRGVGLKALADTRQGCHPQEGIDELPHLGTVWELGRRRRGLEGGRGRPRTCPPWGLRRRGGREALCEVPFLAGPISSDARHGRPACWEPPELPPTCPPPGASNPGLRGVGTSSAGCSGAPRACGRHEGCLLSVSGT